MAAPGAPCNPSVAALSLTAGSTRLCCLPDTLRRPSSSRRITGAPRVLEEAIVEVREASRHLVDRQTGDPLMSSRDEPLARRGFEQDPLDLARERVRIPGWSEQDALVLLEDVPDAADVG